ncbi:MAG: hypothetical protein MUF04_06490 [Akkermansiaceae bacterium]|nr:hypothetical protein [Akkermansiaceae bacterium]
MVAGDFVFAGGRTEPLLGTIRGRWESTGERFTLDLL